MALDNGKSGSESPQKMTSEDLAFENQQIKVNGIDTEKKPVTDEDPAFSGAIPEFSQTSNSTLEKPTRRKSARLAAKATKTQQRKQHEIALLPASVPPKYCYKPSLRMSTGGFGALKQERILSEAGKRRRMRFKGRKPKPKPTVG
ncbi:hypothetical protein TSTA_008590 [Talaromyces stipitatus ATCC 10500]|uniref:Uncharacterized protein n=1 Tax=Talaromyces stipitatus (strain ATCC 10500 / CBS 375.48 / QM 6759 / NRRL 1006) TaxID=441959 RepID=B8MVA7_TALSN|nr:uncharacterized protein TSTA_008590 [Talaromyces stipitatus ATCC 10500]EED11563.1 hypothetical protein TSTA_008590 [Talaromyces stipitatus ATCC 10500]